MRRSARSSSKLQDDSSSTTEEQNAGRKKKSKKPPICKPTQWVAVIPESVSKPTTGAEKSGNTHSFMDLADPKTGLRRQYLVSEEARKICEVQKCSDEPRSWFIGDTVQTDGSLLVCTPVDPLFLALPYLTRAAKTKFTTLEAILDDPAHSNISILERYIDSEQWRHICDIKVLADAVTVYRYSESKTIKWLKRKIELLSGQLQQSQVQVGPGSHSSTLLKSKKLDSTSKEGYLRYACGIVCEYLSKDMANMLSNFYSAKGVKRAGEELVHQPPIKKQRADSTDSGFSSQQSCLGEDDSQTDRQQSTTAANSRGDGDGGSSGGPVEDYTKYNTSLPPVQPSTNNKKLNKAQKALSKASTKGMTSLSKLFGQKQT